MTQPKLVASDRTIAVYALRDIGAIRKLESDGRVYVLCKLCGCIMIECDKDARCAGAKARKALIQIGEIPFHFER
jgi:hypothetical protein